MADLVARWWNSGWGRMTRRDVFLRVHTTWKIEARQGGPEGHSNVREFASEREARTYIEEHCLVPPGEWRDITSISQPARPPAQPAGAY
jgi:hypothetical protein